MAPKVTLLLATFLLFAPQDDNQEETVDTWVETLKSSLDLDSDQERQARSFVEDYMKSTTGALDTYKEEMNKILNDDQKESFEDMNEAYAQGQGGGGWGGRGGRGGRGGWGQGWSQSLPTGKELKGVLGLTDEQTEKIDGIKKEAGDKEREEWAKMREEGWEGFDWQAYQRERREKQKKAEKEVDDVLTEEQKERLKDYKRNKRRYPEVYGALGDLDIKDAEVAGAILDLLMAVARAKRDLERQEERNRRSARSILRDKEKSDEEHGTALDELRTKRREASTELRNAQKKLREVVSYRQELVLLRHSFLK